MSHPTGFGPHAFGPFGALFQQYFAALESFGAGPQADESANPLDPENITSQATAPLRAAALCQLEVLGFLNRRTQAYMQVPTRLAQCRAPQDFINEQMAFWRTAGEQYRESMIKMGEAWGNALPAFAAQAKPERDYITFNGATSSSAGKDRQVPVRQEGGKQRRVA
jgi:hypothetical protein